MFTRVIYNCVFFICDIDLDPPAMCPNHSIPRHGKPCLGHNIPSYRWVCEYTGCFHAKLLAKLAFVIYPWASSFGAPIHPDGADPPLHQSSECLNMTVVPVISQMCLLFRVTIVETPGSLESTSEIGIHLGWSKTDGCISVRLYFLDHGLMVCFLLMCYCRTWKSSIRRPDPTMELRLSLRRDTVCFDHDRTWLDIALPVVIAARVI